MKKKRNYLKQIYKENPETKAFIIEVSLDNYNEVFNGWDPSPIKRRDLDPDFIHFIEECAYDIPLKYNVELHFFLPENQLNEEKESLTKDGITNNFKFIIHFIKKELLSIRKKTLMYIIMSFTFLVLAFLLQKNDSENIVLTTVNEGLYIGGWVFLWEAFSLMFFTGQEIHNRLKRYIRFLQSLIIFNYR